MIGTTAVNICDHRATHSVDVPRRPAAGLLAGATDAILVVCYVPVTQGRLTSVLLLATFLIAAVILFVIIVVQPQAPPSDRFLVSVRRSTDNVFACSVHSALGVLLLLYRYLSPRRAHSQCVVVVTGTFLPRRACSQCAVVVVQVPFSPIVPALSVLLLYRYLSPPSCSLSVCCCCTGTFLPHRARSQCVVVVTGTFLPRRAHSQCVVVVQVPFSPVVPALRALLLLYRYLSPPSCLPSVYLPTST